MVWNPFAGNLRLDTPRKITEAYPWRVLILPHEKDGAPGAI